MNFLYIDPPNFAHGSKGDLSPPANNKQVAEYEVVSKNKSDYAVNAINNYWVQFTLASDSKK